MSESLWDEVDVPSKPKHRPRKVSAPPVNVAPQPQPMVVRPAFVKREAPRDLAFEDAIRALAPLLHPDELDTYKYIIRPALKPDIQAKILDWRQRNGLA